MAKKPSTLREACSAAVRDPLFIIFMAVSAVHACRREAAPEKPGRETGTEGKMEPREAPAAKVRLG